MPLTAGTKLGPYEIQSPAGAGGMGEVYRARDTRLERTVAIKVLPAPLSSSPELRQRLEREARSISSLNHPHICHLYDIGSQGGTDFLVMEYLEGETLAQRLENGPLPLEQTLQTGIEIAEALDKAHRQGIVHRDLKPGNIMLTKSGAKLMDFGLAKPAASSLNTRGAAEPVTRTTPTMSIGALALSPSAEPVTKRGTLIGTFQYMAPEQVEGHEADARSDIFAFGAVLYEMASGKRAFDGKSPISVLGAILEKEPEPLTQLKPMTPAGLQRAVSRCLMKDPEQRWQCAADLKWELEWLRSTPGAAAEEARPRKWKAVAVAAGAAFILLLAVVAFWLSRPEPKQDLIQAYIPAPPKTNFEVAEDDVAGPAVISPTGHYLAFTAVDDTGKREMWVRDLAENTSAAVPGTEGATYPFWSPDERSIGFFAAGKLKRVGAHGGPVLSLCEVQRARGGSWAANGNIVFAPDVQAGIWAVSERGGAARQVTRLAPYHTTHRWPLFLPDGRHFLYFAGNHQDSGANERNGIYAASLDGRENRFLLPADSSFAVASGFLLFLEENTLMAQPFDASRAQLSGDALPIGASVYRNPGTWRANFDVSSNGLLVYHPAVSGGGSQLLWVGRDGKTLGTLGERDLIHDVSLSRDGRKLAVEAGATLHQLWIYDTVRGTRSRITFGANAYETPVWSPDGSRIAFAQSHGGPNAFDLYVKSVEGSGSEELIFASPESKVVLDWSPDGRYLLFGMGRPAALWLLPLTGEKKAQPLLRGPYSIWDGAFSPDGHWLAYESSETGQNEIYITRFPSLQGKWQISNGGRTMSWRPDGKAILYVTTDGSLAEVELSYHGNDLEVGSAKSLFKQQGRSTPTGSHGYAVSPDGQRFIITKLQEEFSSLNLLLHWTAALRK